MLRQSLVALSAIALSAASAHAQESAPRATTQVISVQPIPAVLAVFAAEYERAVSPEFSLGVGATGWFPDELSYTSVEVKARYYPQARALTGFSVGGSLGLTSVRDDDDDGPGVDAIGPSFGVLLNYGWLRGPTRRFYVGLGVGAKSVFVDQSLFDGELVARYPTTRISVGYAF